jgi:hypothetical protein
MNWFKTLFARRAPATVRATTDPVATASASSSSAANATGPASLSVDLSSGLRALVREAAVSHGLPVEDTAHGILVQGDLLLDARVFTHDAVRDVVHLVVEFYARSSRLGSRELVETFSGLGNSAETAIRNGFGKFLMSTFHVLIEALLDHQCDQPQAEIEHWGAGERSWTAYVGPTLVQHGGESSLQAVYGPWVDSMKAMFESRAPAGPHWLRVFICSHDGEIVGGEVMLDNEPWDEAYASLRKQEWQCGADYQSLRHFILLVPR